ncbi:hypothetical protein H2200_004706 [Cladophialophora chaetospira]|uniref:Uncharacterized protein n=1 Tax=Cladophialophora chaetospira TaxID=386627 RepID=A0AA39CJQ4_9EURO|nr:hypothetical protein H2200_004706 [Cladophialophora chaetospira]
MAGKSSSIKKPAATPLRREEDKETIDVSMAMRMAGTKFDASVSFGSASDSSCSYLAQSSTTTSATETTASEIELDKFMASLTAAESPDAVIKTIIGKQVTKHYRN